MERLKGSLIYLAGGIQYIPDLGIDWRQKAEKELRGLGIGVLNPMDKATNFANEDTHTQEHLKALKAELKIAKVNNKARAEQLCLEIEKIVKAIVRADLRMVDLSTALLVCIDPARHTAGTYAEMTQAFLQRKPVICFCEAGIEEIPIWWWGHGDHKMFFDSLDSAVGYIKHIHADEDVEHLKRWKFFDYDKIFGRIM